jgi:hypothetical protein
MSSLELKLWEDNEKVIPPRVNFTRNSQEAIRLGQHHLFEGKLTILCVRYDDILFHPIDAGLEDAQWFVSTKPINFEEVQATRITQKEAKRQSSSHCYFYQ